MQLPEVMLSCALTSTGTFPTKIPQRCNACSFFPEATLDRVTFQEGGHGYGTFREKKGTCQNSERHVSGKALLISPKRHCKKKNVSDILRGQNEQATNTATG